MNQTMTMVYVWALLSGLAFAVASVLQHREASSQPADLSMTFGLLRTLAARPLWLAGILADIVGIGAQALALQAGPLIAVEALTTSGVLFALAFDTGAKANRLRTLDWASASLLVASLAVFVGVGGPQDGTAPTTSGPWLIAAAICTVLTGAGFVIARGSSSVRRSVALGFATGAIWAFAAAVLKALIDRVDRHGLDGLVSWMPCALVVLAIGGMIVNQTAFQADRLLWTLPALTVAQPVVGVGFASVIFSEHLDVSGPALLLVVVSGAVALGNVGVLAHREGRQQQRAGPLDADLASRACCPKVKVTGPR